jgi:hypothetical protein
MRPSGTVCGTRTDPLVLHGCGVSAVSPSHIQVHTPAQYLIQAPASRPFSGASAAAAQGAASGRRGTSTRFERHTHINQENKRGSPREGTAGRSSPAVARLL